MVMVDSSGDLSIYFGVSLRGGEEGKKMEFLQLSVRSFTQYSLRIYVAKLQGYRDREDTRTLQDLIQERAESCANI